MQNTYFAGEAYAMYFPNLGPDFFAACYGAPLTYGETTSWSAHVWRDEDVQNYTPPALDTQGFYYQKMLEMTRAAVQDARDKYLVGVTDIHPGADALVALRGPQQLCMDTVDYPDFIARAAMDLLPGFQRMFDDLFALSTTYQQGSTTWMGIWHPGRWYVTSCDFCCMISPAMFEDMILEELNAELDFLDASMFHLDGPGALKHLDRLLELPKLKGIQWVYGDGQPTAAHWLDVLRKIQNAGKMIQVNATPEDLPVLLENLKPEGVMYNIYAPDEDTARRLLHLADAHRKILY
ncbi:MAG: trimethylamine corrinoid protein 2 [Eubacteriales bacterium]|nr:trimethylamine corrinoid protein 2 [Eubacteriales bacterium]